MAFLLIGSLVKPAAIGVEISAWHPNKLQLLFATRNGTLLDQNLHTRQKGPVCGFEVCPRF